MALAEGMVGLRGQVGILDMPSMYCHIFSLHCPTHIFKSVLNHMCMPQPTVNLNMYFNYFQFMTIY